MTTPAPTEPRRPPFDDAATRIKTAYAALIEGTKGIVPLALKFGELLNEEKARTRHNDWLGWLKNNCNLDKRTAQRYMAMAQPESKKRIEDALRVMPDDEARGLSINKAMAIGKGTSKPAEKPTAMQRYDNGEETLVAKLQDVSAEAGVDAAEEAMGKTIAELNATLRTLKKGVKKAA